MLPSKLSRESPSNLKVDNLITDDPGTISNQFNDYFTSIGANLANNISSITGKQPKDFLEWKVKDSIFINPPSQAEVLYQITSTAVGQDNIHPFFLKTARLVIAPYLTLFLNFVFTHGIFPSNCKIARIIPIHKSEAKDEAYNYRPISILTCFSKVIKKLIYVRLTNFFIKHKVSYENQYGFQIKVSTSHAMIDVVTHSYDN